MLSSISATAWTRSVAHVIVPAANVLKANLSCFHLDHLDREKGVVGCRQTGAALLLQRVPHLLVMDVDWSGTGNAVDGQRVSRSSVVTNAWTEANRFLIAPVKGEADGEEVGDKLCTALRA